MKIINTNVPIYSERFFLFAFPLELVLRTGSNWFKIYVLIKYEQLFYFAHFSSRIESSWPTIHFFYFKFSVISLFISAILRLYHFPCVRLAMHFLLNFLIIFPKTTYWSFLINIRSNFTQTAGYSDAICDTQATKTNVTVTILLHAREIKHVRNIGRIFLAIIKQTIVYISVWYDTINN